MKPMEKKQLSELKARVDELDKQYNETIAEASRLRKEYVKANRDYNRARTGYDSIIGRYYSIYGYCVFITECSVSESDALLVNGPRFFFKAKEESKAKSLKFEVEIPAPDSTMLGWIVVKDPKKDLTEITEEQFLNAMEAQYQFTKGAITGACNKFKNYHNEKNQQTEK